MVRWLYIQLVFRVWGLIIRQVSWVEKYTLNNYCDNVYQLEKVSGIMSVNEYDKYESTTKWHHKCQKRRKIKYFVFCIEVYCILWRKGYFTFQETLRTYWLIHYEKLIVFNSEAFPHTVTKMFIKYFSSVQQVLSWASLEWVHIAELSFCDFTKRRFYQKGSMGAY